MGCWLFRAAWTAAASSCSGMVCVLVLFVSVSNAIWGWFWVSVYQSLVLSGQDLFCASWCMCVQWVVW